MISFEEEQLKIRIISRLEKNSNCWEWQGALNTSGYPIISYNNKTTLVHRLMYELYVGELINNLVIDHICNNIKCCNPFHLDQITCSENILKGIGPTAINKRKTHCKLGHELTEKNTYIAPNSVNRDCRTCRKLRRK